MSWEFGALPSRKSWRGVGLVSLSGHRVEKGGRGHPLWGGLCLCPEPKPLCTLMSSTALPGDTTSLECHDVGKMEQLWDQPWCWAPGIRPIPQLSSLQIWGGHGSRVRPCARRLIQSLGIPWNGEGTGFQAQSEGCERLHKPRARTGGRTRAAPTQARRKAGSFPAKPAVGREIFGAIIPVCSSPCWA